jgi:DNA-binding NtrC family response regulator
MATLLIVDDDTLVRGLLTELFQTHEVHTADRTEQALEYLDLENYDVIFTDLSMPGLSGVEILNRIQESYPATPVIVISGKASEEAAQALLDQGAFAYFAKPFDLDEVEDALVRAISHRQKLLSVLSKPKA